MIDEIMENTYFIVFVLKQAWHGRDTGLIITPHDPHVNVVWYNDAGGKPHGHACTPFKSFVPSDDP